MKPYIHIVYLFILSCVFYNTTHAQDTLYLKNKSKIICKVEKISETDIEYRKWSNLTGPIYTIDVVKVKEIHFYNGQVEYVAVDEMDVNKEVAILDRRNAVKLDFFSPLFDKITVGYETSIKVGWNLEIYGSFISNKILSNNIGGSVYNNLKNQGIGFKIGNKFLLGNDYYIKGTKYAHPLKGRFIRFDVTFSQFSIMNLYQNLYAYDPNLNYYTHSLDKGNLNVSQFGFFVGYGRQFILANMFTVQYNIGFGYGFQSEKFVVTEKNAAYPNNNYVQYYEKETGYYFGSLGNMIKIANSPLAVSGNFTFGYILGGKDSHKTPKQSETK